jgi:menaquinone reductase, multiheme cytochrome c subunit
MVFPKWTNKVPSIAAVAFLALSCATIFVFWYWLSPKHLTVGYQPVQPIAYSHKLHVSQFGMDCLYCHYNVERGQFAGVPPTEVCMNCHTLIKPDFPEIVKIREAFASGKPIPWVRANKLAEYAYFNHSAHVNKGVSCVSCHDRVDQMDVVRVAKPLSMIWCMDCHTNPAPNIRDKKLITNLAWQPTGDPAEYGREFMKKYHITTRTDCNTCHR